MAPYRAVLRTLSLFVLVLSGDFLTLPCVTVAEGLPITNTNVLRSSSNSYDLHAFPLDNTSPVPTLSYEKNGKSGIHGRSPISSRAAQINSLQNRGRSGFRLSTHLMCVGSIHEKENRVPIKIVAQSQQNVLSSITDKIEKEKNKFFSMFHLSSAFPSGTTSYSSFCSFVFVFFHFGCVTYIAHRFSVTLFASFHES